MVELRLTDPDKLHKVEEAQRKALERAGKLNEFVSITEGIDQTLISLIPDIDNRDELRQRITDWRQQSGYSVKESEYSQAT